MESIHRRIKRLRDKKGLSQEALGDLVGVKYQSVQEWEREDGTAPSRKRMELVAEALGVSVQELVMGTEAPSMEAAPEMTDDEVALIVRYRSADPRWQLSLRLLAALATEDQIEAATDVNVIIARIAGKKPRDMRPIGDKRMRDLLRNSPQGWPPRKSHGEVKRVTQRTSQNGLGRGDKKKTG